MKEKLTPRRLNSLPVTGKEYEIHHTAVPGLFVRVTAAGAKSYVVTWARGRKKTLGRVGIMTLAQAEEEALQYLTEARKHGEPLAVAQGRKGSASPTLRDFIDDTYLPWFKAHHQPRETTHTLSTCFEPIMSRRLVEVTGRDLEQIRTDWLKAGNKPSTANRKMGTLSGVFSRAVDWSYLEASPLDKVKALKVDTKGRIRYLSKDEAKALREAWTHARNGCGLSVTAPTNGAQSASGSPWWICAPSPSPIT